MKIGRNDPCPCGSGKKYKHCCLRLKATASEPVLLLFGAGASFGSQPVNHPPLARDLFDKLCAKYPTTWRNVADDVASMFREDFEEGMDFLYKQAQDTHQYNVAKLLKDMAIYFSEFKTDTANSYYSFLVKRFADSIIQRKIVIATLNYECLIENSLLSQGINVDYFGNSVGVRILKLHGSCNFIPRNFVGNDTNLTLNLDFATINAPIETVDPQTVEQELENIPIPPAMSLFTREKRNIINPSQIQKLVLDFQEYVKAAKTIITIGVRPYPVDVHVWEPISQSNADLFLVANRKQCTEWISKYRTQHSQHIGETFQSSWDQICQLIAARL